jgi:hypothetical protein
VRTAATWAACAISVAAFGAACTSVTTVRLQPETVEVRPGLRPLAAIQANATSMYVLFVPVAGEVSLDRVVNQMLIVRAKTLGADKIAQLAIEITPDDGIWALRKLFGWRSARASGIAVQITDLPPDPDAEQGPEPPADQPAGPP